MKFKERIEWVQKRMKLCLHGRREQIRILKEMFDKEKNHLLKTLLSQKKSKKKEADPTVEEFKTALLNIELSNITLTLMNYIDTCRNVLREN